MQSLRDRAWAEVRTTQNRAASIHSLPPEILGDVLLRIAGDRTMPFDRYDQEYYKRRRLRGDRNRWLRVTTVCRHWREVALRQPSLWNVVDYGPKWCATLDAAFNTQWFHRAGQSPLYIFIDTLQDMTLDALTEVSSRCSQIKELRVSDWKSNECLAKFDAPAPLLERLWLQPLHEYSRMKHGYLPPLFAGQAAALRSLNLTTVHLPETPFRSLRRLSLYSQEYSKRKFFENLLFTLQETPLLEELQMSWCHSKDDDLVLSAVRAYGKTLSLPLLSIIEFNRCSSAVIGSVLRCINIADEQNVNYRVVLAHSAVLELPIIFPD